MGSQLIISLPAADQIIIANKALEPVITGRSADAVITNSGLKGSVVAVAGGPFAGVDNQNRLESCRL